VKCLCGILDAVPHFNYISDVLQVLVPNLNSSDEQTRQLATSSLQLLLSRDTHGDVMVEAVQLVADMIRSRKCVCHPDAVRCLLVLDFKDINRDDVRQGAACLRVLE
jgi:nucleolar complex protein 3